MNNTLWTEDEFTLIDRVLADGKDISILVEMLPHRSLRAIRKQVWRRGHKKRESYDTKRSGPVVLDPSDPGDPGDGEGLRHELGARMGSEALLRALVRANLTFQPAQLAA